MEKIEILEILQSIVRYAIDNDELVIDEDTVATDVEGWDSLAQLLIVGELQNKFGVKFSSKEIGYFANVGELVNAIQTKL